MRTARLVALGIAGAALLNFPLVGLWDRSETVFGIPLEPFAVFGAWALLIALAAWLAERGRDADDADE